MNKVVWSRKSDHWSTPKKFLNSLGRIDFDPCPLHGSFKDSFPLTKWHGRVFINPPYSDIKNWISLGFEAMKYNRVTELIYLLPARTDTKWFHELCMPFASEIQFLKGRLKFGNAKNSAPFPSMVVYFKK